MFLLFNSKLINMNIIKIISCIRNPKDEEQKPFGIQLEYGMGETLFEWYINALERNKKFNALCERVAIQRDIEC